MCPFGIFLLIASLMLLFHLNGGMCLINPPKSSMSSNFLCNHKKGNAEFLKDHNYLNYSLHSWGYSVFPFARGSVSPCFDQGLVSSRLKSVPPSSVPFYVTCTPLWQFWNSLSTFSKLTLYFTSCPLGWLLFFFFQVVDLRVLSNNFYYEAYVFFLIVP